MNDLELDFDDQEAEFIFDAVSAVVDYHEPRVILAHIDEGLKFRTLLESHYERCPSATLINDPSRYLQ